MLDLNEKFNELLGILKSINYDEVINELEINALSEWISINENNSDPRFQEIIGELRKILEDTIVTKEEKEKIVEITEQYYSISNSMKDISELVGIIKGIISDNEINLAEAIKLKKWLGNNVQLSGNYFYDRVSIMVSDVLADNILDEDEKKKLMIFLKFLLNDNNLNHRIDILKKRVKNNELIGNQLINLIDDNTIVAKIHKEAIRQLNILLKRRCSVFDVDSEIIYISLTLIALLSYNGNYYNYVEEVYSELYVIYNPQRIAGTIRDVINRYKNSNSDDEYRIISSVLRNALVPKPYLPSFFDFIFDIYRLNFEYKLDSNANLQEEFAFVYGGIKKGLNLENNTLDLKVTNKTYSLIVTTKDLILDDTKIDELITLSISVLKIIDNYYWNNPNLEIINEYFKYGFENWKKKIDKSIQDKKRISSEFRSRWEPELKLDGDKVFLSIPNHKIRNNYDYEKLEIRITNGEEIIYRNYSPNVFDIIGGYRIENPDVQIDRPLGNLRYILMCGDEIIYDSKDKLYRNFIFFDNENNELKNNRDYEGIAMLCSREEHVGINIISRNNNYIVGYINVNIGDYIKINDEMFNFATIQYPGVIGKTYDGYCISNGNKCLIYSEVEGIVYESEKTSKNIAVIINNVRHKLEEYGITINKRGLYYNYYIKMGLKNNLYNISFEEYNNDKYERIKEFNFLLDNNFNYNLEEIGNGEYSIKIDCLERQFSKVVNYDMDDINNISFIDQNIVFNLPLNIKAIKIDSNNWSELLDSYLWIKDINNYSNLRTNGIKFDKVFVLDEKGTKLTTLHPTENGYYYDLAIGSLKSYEYKKYVILDFYKDDVKIGLLYCYCQCYIDKVQLWYDRTNNKYNCNISYFGKGNIVLQITDEKNNIVFEENVNNGEVYTIDNLKSFINYKVEVIDKKTGFTLESDNVLYEGNIKYYLMSDFVGKYFQIYSVDYDQLIQGVFTRKTRFLYNTYIEIIEKISDYEFLGNVYIYRRNKNYLDKINPVEIEFTSDITDGKVEASITKEEDGLLLDFDHNTIYNELEIKKATDIFSYEINVERKKRNE